MTTIFYSKFIWADWLLDQALRRCSPAARALWIDMLALSVRAEPVGVLADGNAELTAADVARAAGMNKKSAARLIGELERNGVFSRDERGRIYSRRLVREHRARQCNKANGSRGGNPQLAAKNAAAPVNPLKLEVKSQESEATSQQLEPRRAAPAASQVAPIVRAAEAMGTSLDAFHKKPAWLAFGYTFATWVQDGCDAERDVWPVLSALSAKLGAIPQSPAYFGDAVREARDRRLGVAAKPAPAPSQGAPVAAAWVSPERRADRLAAYGETGHWPAHWGEKPKPENGTPGSEGASP